MVSQINMAGLLFAVLFSIGCGLIPFFLLWKRSAAIETGMIGAVCYGMLGFFWAQLLLRYALMAVIGNLSVFVRMKDEFYLGYLVVSSLISGGTAMLANMWALYLTNQKQKSLYRSATVGIGYRLLEVGIYTIMPFISAVQINSGSFHGTEELKQSIIGSNTVDLFLGGYKYGVLVVVSMVIALIMGKFFLEGKIQKPIFFGLAAYGLLYFIRGGLGKICSTAVYRVTDLIFLTLVGVAAVYIFVKWKDWTVNPVDSKEPL